MSGDTRARPSNAYRRHIWAYMPGGVLLAVAAVVASGPFGARLISGPIDGPLLAYDPPAPDYDGDGIPDAQETILNLSQFDCDTDGDGLCDAEEFARQADPLNSISLPTSGVLSAGMSARGENGLLRLFIALYSTDGDFNSSVLRLGALVQGQVISVPIDRLLPNARIQELNVSNGAKVMTIDLGLSPSIAYAYGHVTYFLALGETGNTSYVSATKVDIFAKDHVLILSRTSYSQTGQTGTGGGSIRQPIPAGGPGGIPITWTPGQICFQRSQIVGGSGLVLLHEIVEADCMPGWDTYCESDCSASVGSTYQTLDPAVLIGG